MKKVLAVLIAVLVLAGAGFGGYKYLQYKHKQELALLQGLYDEAQSEIADLEEENDALMNPPEIQITVTTLKEYIAPASELITYKYYYTDSGTYEKNKKFFDSNIKIPFTTDKSVYVYSGKISAGVDIDDINFNVNNPNKTIEVKMPKPKIIAHELDEKSFKTYDVKNSVFTSSSLDNFADFQGALKATQEDKINSNTEFWDSVKDNAENVIKSLLTVNDEVKEFKIEFTWSED